MLNQSSYSAFRRMMTVFVTASLVSLVGGGQAVALPIQYPSDPSVPPVPEINTAICNSLVKDRNYVLKQLAEGASSETIAIKLALCNDSAILPLPTWNTYYEEVDKCGYHPQRREFGCHVNIKQRFGYGGTPPTFPTGGTFEWVTVCVNQGGWRVVDISAVHVHDEQWGIPPSWDYWVSLDADPRLHGTLLQGQTLNAIGILRWFVPNSTCNFEGGWGNQIPFKIKLDP